jgi:uncharacterized membrane protein YedE/YeeE
MLAILIYSILFMHDFLRQSWPWYVGGVLIGLMVPALLIAGNKTLGVSSTLRQICAACFPFDIPFLKYNWKKESWSLFFAGGIIIGGFIAGFLLADGAPEKISAHTLSALNRSGVHFNKGFLPEQIFNWNYLLTVPGFIILVGGGFLVGFGTRYAGGCTSGHGIMGLSTLQWPSLVAVVSFFISGIVSAKYLLPIVLRL